jgi:hypothetical protein
MPHVLYPTPPLTLEGKYKGQAYKNAQGQTECVEFIRQALGAPQTALWREGTKIKKGVLGIAPGTAIATFVSGKYPQTGSTGKHAAIYMGQNGSGIQVMDQWASQGMVLPRTIYWIPRNQHPSASNDANAFSVIEW